MTDQFGLMIWGLIASPIYIYLVTSLGSRAYFKAKLRYHHELFNGLGPNSSPGS